MLYFRLQKSVKKVLGRTSITSVFRMCSASVPPQYRYCITSCKKMHNEYHYCIMAAFTVFTHSVLCDYHKKYFSIHCTNKKICTQNLFMVKACLFFAQYKKMALLISQDNHRYTTDVVGRHSVKHCRLYMRKSTNLEYIILHIANFNAGVF